MPTDRRTFLQLVAAGAVSATFPESIARALAIPAHRRTGTIADVEHIVVMMQENRSFDHYLGTLRGVRGYGDPRAIRMPSGRLVWYQPHGEGYVLPFHPPAPEMGLQFLEDLPHDWTSTHAAWRGGAHDGWVRHKGPTTMAYLTRSDIPFHYALADAFTVCDAYHCSLLGPTDPNRFYLWTGWVGNDGQSGGPALDNSGSGYGWSTFPEQLHRAGVSWKLYQDLGHGLHAEEHWGDTEDAYIGNYGDNPLLFFRQYENAAAGTPLFEGAKTGTKAAQGGSLFEQFRQDVLTNTLPQVSWIVTPEAYCEHPNWPANYGAWYVSQVLDALTANPDLWSRTVFLLTYDENDGFFDHIPPPTVPPGEGRGRSTVDTRHELYAGSHEFPAGPYGMGPRVPMFVISPWSKGGWVDSEVFDHTSVIRFIERRFPELAEDNITPWRRAVAGDMTSAFDFAAPDAAPVPLPSTIAYTPPDSKRHPDYRPQPPARQTMPTQEPGTRPARAVPYASEATGDRSAEGFRLRFHNSGKRAAVLQVYAAGKADEPRTYTVGPGAELADNWVPAQPGGAYDLSVHGPNGFLRGFRGGAAATAEELAVRCACDAGRSMVSLEIRNPGPEAVDVSIHDAYTGKAVHRAVPAGQAWSHAWPLAERFGWYDLTVTAGGAPEFARHFAGHVETGEDSRTDPLLGGLRDASRKL